jgi:hypothetical protein
MRVTLVSLVSTVSLLAALASAFGQSANPQAQPSQQKPLPGPCFDDLTEQTAHARGYNVLAYDASTGATKWFPQHKYLTVPDLDHGPFLPVAWTKDQIMVEVCHLKFDSQVNVSLSYIAIPERGADIRGATATVTAPTITPGTITDALQNVTNSTNNALAATLPLNSSPAGLSANTIVVMGSMKAGVYTGATIAETPADFARAVRAYDEEARATLKAIQDICFIGQLEGRDQCKSEPPLDYDKATGAFGTLWSVMALARHVRSQIDDYSHREDANSNVGTFDLSKAQAQQFSVVLAALDSAVTSANFPARIASLAANYRTINADIAALKDIEAIDLKEHVSQTCEYGSAPYPQPGTVESTETDTKPKGTTKKAQTVQRTQVSPTVQEERQDEYCAIVAFESQYQNDLSQIDSDTVLTPSDLYAELAALRSDLQTLNQVANQSFAELNDWYARSSVVYTDALTPSTTNTGVRIGINALDMYVPFTLGFTASPGSASVSSSSGASGHFGSSTQLQIQRRANFNLVGGVIMIHVPTKNYSLTPSAIQPTPGGGPYTPCGPGSTAPSSPTTGTLSTFYCPTVTQSTDWQVAGIAALNWFPWGRNYYPDRTQPWRTFRDMFGVMLGSSVTSLGSGFGGLSFEPVNGISLYSGITSAHSQRLPTGVYTSTVYTTTSNFSPVTTLHAGFSAGIGFDLSVFLSILKPAGPTLP